VAKADQIVDKVKAIIEKHRKIDSLLNLSLTVAYNFHKDELPTISNFLLAHHKPSTVKTVDDAQAPPIQNAKNAIVRAYFTQILSHEREQSQIRINT
jgi:hypothetical protein